MLPRFFRFLYFTWSPTIVFRTCDFRRISKSEQFRCFAGMFLVRLHEKPDWFFLTTSIHFRSMIKTLSTDAYGKSFQRDPRFPFILAIFVLFICVCSLMWSFLANDKQSPWMTQYEENKSGREALKMQWHQIVCIFWRDSYKFQNHVKCIELE